jgi:CheY-like chemotaxis protein
MKKILVADDNQQNLYMLSAALKGNGYEVVEARNGRAALELARREPPDLAISDILMPEMDGYELCRVWKADGKLKSIPFVFYTATYTDPKDEDFGLSLGADRFLKKPAKLEVLLRAVEEVLAGAAAGTPAAAAKGGSEAEALVGHRDAIFRKLQRKIEQLEAEVEARRKAEAALADAAGELKEKNRQLQDFIYISSYDLRDPLVNMRGFSNNLAGFCAEAAALLKEGGDKRRLAELLAIKAPEALDRISGSVECMDRLISGLLRLARLWDMPFERTAIDMNRLAAETLESAHFLIKQAGAAVNCGKLPQCSGDKAQIKKIFSVLLDNSLKYRHHSRKLEITITGELQPSGMAVYRFADNGTGLTKAEEEGLIWQLFYRGNLKELVPGEGVGLTIARRIAEKHGGKIKAAARSGGGAEFTVLLPAAPKS